MENKIDTLRIGICKHINREVLQCFDGVSQDAQDEIGWFCLHNNDTDDDKLMELMDLEDVAIYRGEILNKNYNNSLIEDILNTPSLN